MSFVERGPLNLKELTDPQRAVLDRLCDAGWSATAFGYASRELDLAHPNGRRCTVLPNGDIEAVEDAAA